jgi:hypothetical protein
MFFPQIIRETYVQILNGTSVLQLLVECEYPLLYLLTVISDLIWALIERYEVFKNNWLLSNIMKFLKITQQKMTLGYVYIK